MGRSRRHVPRLRQDAGVGARHRRRSARGTDAGSAATCSSTRTRSASRTASSDSGSRSAPVVLDVVKPIDRCVMTTRPQPGGIERDLDVLRTINAERQTWLGVGTLVVQPRRDRRRRRAARARPSDLTAASAQRDQPVARRPVGPAGEPSSRSHAAATGANFAGSSESPAITSMSRRRRLERHDRDARARAARRPRAPATGRATWRIGVVAAEPHGAPGGRHRGADQDEVRPFVARRGRRSSSSGRRRRRSADRRSRAARRTPGWRTRPARPPTGAPAGRPDGRTRRAGRCRAARRRSTSARPATSIAVEVVERDGDVLGRDAVPPGSTAAASEPGVTLHGARTAPREPGRRRHRPVGPAALRARPRGGPNAGAADDGLDPPATSAAAAPPGEVGRRHPGAQQGGDDRPGRRPDDEVGAPGVPAELVGERREHAGVEGVTDRAPGAEHEGDAGHGGQSRSTCGPTRRHRPARRPMSPGRAATSTLRPATRRPASRRREEEPMAITDGTTTGPDDGARRPLRRRGRRRRRRGPTSSRRSAPPSCTG